ncbi:MAG: hypothetical protein ACI4ME_09530 [Aristaeellaceae bacterium]
MWPVEENQPNAISNRRKIMKKNRQKHFFTLTRMVKCGSIVDEKKRGRIDASLLLEQMKTDRKKVR